jgi:putative ABC transport system permease protein
MLLLTLRDFTHRAARFSVVIVATAMVFTLLFLMTGLVEQFNREPFLSVAQLGDGTWAVPAGVSGPFTASSLMDPALADRLVSEGMEPVVVARGTLTIGSVQTEAVVIGQAAGSVRPVMVDGRPTTSPDEVLIDESTGVAVGDRVLLSDSAFTVSGLTSDTTLLAGQPLVFADIDAVRGALFGGAPVTSAGIGDAVEVAGADMLTAAEVAEDALGPLENAISSVDLIRVLVWVVAGIIIGAVVYLSALERSRDFAVLRAIGARTGHLSASLAIQALAIALLAALLATALQALVAPVFPLKVSVPVAALWQLPLLAMVVGLAAAAAGMGRVRRTDPAKAFAGPGA